MFFALQVESSFIASKLQFLLLLLAIAISFIATNPTFIERWLSLYLLIKKMTVLVLFAFRNSIMFRIEPRLMYVDFCKAIGFLCVLMLMHSNFSCMPCK